MEILSDVSASSALVWATIEAEKAYDGLSRQGGLQSVLENSIISPSSLTRQEIKGGEYEAPRRKKKQHPIKTIPPPSTCKLDSFFLVDRITSLQKRALVGQWYFPDKEDS